MKDQLGDRLKEYEMQETNQRFLPNVPVYARIDGRCFSRLTRKMDRPFDAKLHEVMCEVTRYLVKETNALVAYTQSDEISLGFYNSNPTGAIFFNGRKFKMTSMLAAMASAKFYQQYIKYWPDQADDVPLFDARVFQVPSLAELTNAFIWRQQDCIKNAVSTAASCNLPHADLLGKTTAQKQELLFQRCGINFNDYPVAFKSGTFARRVLTEHVMSVVEYEKIPESNRPKDNRVVRSKIETFYIPRITALTDPVQQLLFGV